MQSKAHPRLLDTYNIERQPIGEAVVSRANASLRDHKACFPVLGMTEPSLEKRKDILAEFGEASDRGRAKRAAWRKALEARKYEHAAAGFEMNQRYVSSAVYSEDEPGSPPPYDQDPVLHYQPSTYPGSRLPHAWLNKATPTQPISTHDLAGKGGFAVITGIGGKQPWSAVANAVGTELGVDIRVSSVGWRQDFEDSYWSWEDVRGVEDDGAVLVRPDRFVAWRSQNKEGATVQKLMSVMRKLLSLDY